MIAEIPKGTSTIVCFNELGEITKEIEIPALVQNVELIIPSDLIKASKMAQNDIIQNSIIEDLEIENSVPSVEELKKKLHQNEGTEVEGPQYDNQGLMTVSEMKRRIFSSA